ncbi:hypothetical protein EB230_31240 [Mesorhizobium sp. NZP2234]|nr:hypothetical protein EB230_31240 [Mesorhizobium sp. NZP2234]
MLGKRRLSIFNSLFLPLSMRGHASDAYEHDGEIHARAIMRRPLGLDIATGIDASARGAFYEQHFLTLAAFRRSAWVRVPGGTIRTRLMVHRTAMTPISPFLFISPSVDQGPDCNPPRTDSLRHCRMLSI